MVRKGWKKTRENAEGIRWENLKTGKVVFVHTLHKRKETTHHGARKKTIIATEFQDWEKPRTKRFSDKDFKTKAQALRFAKSYMRKH